MVDKRLDLETKNWREEFEQKGYVSCKGFFSQDEIASLWENINFSDKPEETSGRDQNKLQFHTKLLKRNPKIQELIAQKKIVDLLSQIIGDNIWVRLDQAVSKDPGASMMPWHQDNPYSQCKQAYYQLWIPLTKMTPENGGLWIQPGSYCRTQTTLPHQYIDGFFAYQGVPESPLFVEANPGDILVFSSFLLHCTSPNITHQSRWSYVVECLPIECFDPLVEAPYFVIARDGKPYSKFIYFFWQRLNPINILKYSWFKLKNVWYCWLRPVVRLILKS
jgi:hypothetical protein